MYVSLLSYCSTLLLLYRLFAVLLSTYGCAGSGVSGMPIQYSNRYGAADDSEELPAWKRHLSFRGQSYRYAHHQNGVMGHFQVLYPAWAPCT